MFGTNIFAFITFGFCMKTSERLLSLFSEV